MSSANTSFNQHVSELKDLGASYTNSALNKLNRAPEKQGLGDRESSSTPKASVENVLSPPEDANERITTKSETTTIVQKAKYEKSAKKLTSNAIEYKSPHNLSKSNNEHEKRCTNISGSQVMTGNDPQVREAAHGTKLDLRDEVQFPLLSPPESLNHLREPADEMKSVNLPSKINGSPTRTVRPGQRSNASQSKITVAVPKINDAGKKQ
jgi:hypothetical protein